MTRMLPPREPAPPPRPRRLAKAPGQGSCPRLAKARPRSRVPPLQPAFPPFSFGQAPPLSCAKSPPWRPAPARSRPRPPESRRAASAGQAVPAAPAAWRSRPAARRPGAARPRDRPGRYARASERRPLLVTLGAAYRWLTQTATSAILLLSAPRAATAVVGGSAPARRSPYAGFSAVSYRPIWQRSGSGSCLSAIRAARLRVPPEHSSAS
eukprot:scaffold7746_cov59-Phaeocystis_antarctica.AAC.9